MAFLSGSRAQSRIPQTFSYQAVARGADGKVLANQAIGIKVEILQGSASGNSVYSETHQATSTATGAVNLLIGGGSSEGNISAIDWGSDTFFLKLSMDAEGGTDYQEVSTTQMMPVPYALYAERAGAVKETSGTSTLPFVLVPDDSDYIYKVIKGETLYYDLYQTETTGYLTLSFSISYLNGIDQELMAAIEDLPEGSEEQEAHKVSPSCTMGRFYELHYSIPSGEDQTYHPKLVIRDKDNNVIKEYPFILAPDRRQ